jgi:hypothetical protein
MWTYLPWGPYAGFADYLAALEAGLLRQDFVTYAIIAADTGRAVGIASYLNINPSAGSIEVGGITYSPALPFVAAIPEVVQGMPHHQEHRFCAGGLALPKFCGSRSRRPAARTPFYADRRAAALARSRRSSSQRASQKPSRLASKATAIRVIVRPALTASSRQRCSRAPSRSGFGSSFLRG